MRSDQMTANAGDMMAAGDNFRKGHCGLKNRRFSVCVGCGLQIHDQFILRVAPNLEWHAACLKCVECQMFLDETHTCFVRDGKTFCKKDYIRLFGAKCDRCLMSFGKNDFVMRAKNKIFHTKCFRCTLCQKELIPGDEFAMSHDGLLCKADANSINNNNNNLSTADGSGSKNNHKDSIENNNNINNNNNSSTINHSNSSEDNSEPPCDLSDEEDMSVGDSQEEIGMIGGGGGGSKKMLGHAGGHGGSGGGSSAHHQERSGSGAGHHKKGGDRKSARARTVLSEKQLNILKTCYSANPRPDALMKEQLVEMTGLSPRVIRVWFQNKRCKDKKLQSRMMEKQMQRETDGRKLGYGGMHGIPMVATSPVRHDSPGMNPVDIHSYEPPWKMLTDFALHTDLDRLNPNTPHYQHIVNQMHGYQDMPPHSGADLAGMPPVSAGDPGMGPPPPGFHPPLPPPHQGDPYGGNGSDPTGFMDGPPPPTSDESLHAHSHPPPSSQTGDMTPPNMLSPTQDEANL